LIKTPTASNSRLFEGIRDSANPGILPVQQRVEGRKGFRGTLSLGMSYKSCFLVDLAVQAKKD